MTHTTKDEALDLALKAAYLAGFNASGEGYNGEYPFGDNNQNPEHYPAWCKDRENELIAIKQARSAPVQEFVCSTGLCHYKTQPAPVQEPVAVYGYCPICGAEGVMRERRLNGYDKCAKGHTYPSSKATPPAQPAQEEIQRLSALVRAQQITIDKLEAQTAPVQEPVAWMDALKDAFFEGFTSVETYNDSRLNSPEEAWAKYKPPVIPPAASVQQEPVGRVVSANCEYATVQWLRQTSEVGGGDPKNSRSWPIAGDAVYTTPPNVATPLDETSSLAAPAPEERKRQSEWVGLTDEEIDQGLLRSDYALQTAHAWRAGVVFAMTRLKEKNSD